MVGIRFVLSPLEVGTVELERQRGGGEGREREMKFQHVSSLPVLGRYIVLMKNGGCRGNMHDDSWFQFPLIREFSCGKQLPLRNYTVSVSLPVYLLIWRVCVDRDERTRVPSLNRAPLSPGGRGL